MARHHLLCDAIASKLNATTFGSVEEPISVEASRKKIMRQEFESIQKTDAGTVRLYVLAYSLDETNYSDRARTREQYSVAIVVLVNVRAKSLAATDPWDDFAEDLRDWIGHKDQEVFDHEGVPCFKRVTSPTEPELSDDDLLDVSGIYATQVVCDFYTEVRHG